MKIIRVVMDSTYNEVGIDFDDGTQMSVNPITDGIYFYFSGFEIDTDQCSANVVRINRRKNED